MRKSRLASRAHAKKPVRNVPLSEDHPRSGPQRRVDHVKPSPRTEIRSADQPVINKCSEFHRIRQRFSASSPPCKRPHQNRGERKLLFKKFRGLNTPKMHLVYEVRCSGVLRIVFDHMGVFYVRRNLDTSFRVHLKSARPGRESNPRPSG